MRSVFRKNADSRSIFGYIADFVLVIVGVFLGLQAQNWASDRADRARAAQYAERIESDFTVILAELDTCRRLSDQSIDAIERVRLTIEAVSAGDKDAVPDNFATSLIAMTASVMPPGRSAAFVEMISTGDLRPLDSEELRTALVEYDQDAQDNRDTWLLLREMLNPMWPVLFRHISLRKGTSAQAQIGEYDLDGLVRDPEVQSALSAFTATATNAYQLCDSQRVAAQAVMEQLQKR